MKTFAPPPPEIDLDDLVQIVESHRPYLDAGKYVVGVTHHLDTGKGAETFKAAPLNFYVQGDRFSLPEEGVHAVYPPQGAHGIYDHALPHVILTRSSLPWERTPLGEGADELAPSWLALLVFSEDEAAKVKPQVVTVQKSGTGPHLADGKANFGTGLRKEPGQHAADHVNVIDLPWSLLRSVLPRYYDLPGLAHVRRVSPPDAGAPGLSIRPAEGEEDGIDPGTQPPAAKGPELAVVIGNRLPPRNTTCTVHLVSLEDRFVPGSADPAKPARAAVKFSDTDLVGWLKQARHLRNAQGVLGYELELLSGSTPRLRKITDRDEPREHPAEPISAALNLGEEWTDAVCRKLLSAHPQLLKALDTMPEVRVLKRLADDQDEGIGIFEIRVRQAGWQPQDLKPKDLKIFSRLLPNNGSSTLAVTCQGLGAAHADMIKTVEPGIATWIEFVALRKMSAQRRWVVASLAKLGKGDPSGSEPDDLGALLQDRERLRRIVSELPGQEEGTLSQRLGSVLAGDLRLELSAKGKLFGAVLKWTRDDGARATLSRRRPHLAARLRALRDEPVFGAKGLKADSPVRLVSLKSWTFYNKGEARGFTRELLDLNPAPGVDPTADRDAETVHPASSGAFHLPVPPEGPAHSDAAQVAQEHARIHVQAGSTALRHKLRGGEQTLSWYHGPFVVSGFVPPRMRLPARGPDDLTIYDPKTGMFDVSYAAAWELGRMIALEDNDFAVTLFHWKRNHARTLAHLRQKIDHDFLPLVQDRGPSAPPTRLSETFARLARLEPVPFNYLVPDERMLPVDSIRFFDVDPMWLEALRDGAFSIGRVLAKDHLDERVLHRDLTPPARLSGCLLRSNVVGDWQHLVVDAYTGIGPDRSDLARVDRRKFQKLTQERFARLGPNLLLCLFSDPRRAGGEVELVDVHLPAEVLHFGLEISSDDVDGSQSPPLIKRLRDPNTGRDLRAWRMTGAGGLGKDAPPGFQIDAALDLLRISGVLPEVVKSLASVRGQVFDSLPALCQAAKLEIDMAVTPEHEPLVAVLRRYVHPMHAEEQVIRSIPMRDDAAGRVVDVTALMDEVANRMAPVYPGGHRFSGADFALQMLDLPPLVTFLRPNHKGGGA